MNVASHRWAGLGLCLALSLLPLAANAAGEAPAKNDADVRRMIESLRGASAAGSNSRTRNLVVVPAPEAAPAAGPSAGPAAAPTATQTATTTAAPTAPPPAATATRPSAPAAAAPGLSLAIAFEPNSAQLRPESGDTLGALVAAMLSPELRGNQFVIEGHTDASGTPAQNLRLSRERAEQVRLYLVTLGVAGERLRAVGKGASEPVDPRDPRSPENRRVRVVALP